MTKTLKEKLKQDLHKVVKSTNKRFHSHPLTLHEKHVDEDKDKPIYLSVEFKEKIQSYEISHPIAHISLEAGKYVLHSANGYRIFSGDTYDARFYPIYEFIIGFAKENGLEELGDIEGRKPWDEFLNDGDER